MMNGCDDLVSRTDRQACGYQVPPSVDIIECLPYPFVNDEIKRSAMSIFRSFDTLIPRISLDSGSIATQIHMYLEPIFIIVSSMINSVVRFLFLLILLGLYF